jgi:hypothetical protein
LHFSRCSTRNAGVDGSPKSTKSDANKGAGDCRAASESATRCGPLQRPWQPCDTTGQRDVVRPKTTASRRPLDWLSAHQPAAAVVGPPWPGLTPSQARHMIHRDARVIGAASWVSGSCARLRLPPRKGKTQNQSKATAAYSADDSGLGVQTKSENLARPAPVLLCKSNQNPKKPFLHDDLIATRGVLRPSSEALAADTIRCSYVRVLSSSTQPS